MNERNITRWARAVRGVGTVTTAIGDARLKPNFEEDRIDCVVQGDAADAYPMTAHISLDSGPTARFVVVPKEGLSKTALDALKLYMLTRGFDEPANLGRTEYTMQTHPQSEYLQQQIALPFGVGNDLHNV